MDFAKKALALRKEWVDASLVLAAKMYEARQKYTADKEFSAWIKVNQLNRLNAHDRAALIKMGENLTAAREMLESDPGSTSYQLIWGRWFANASKPDISEENQKVSERPSIH